MVILYSQGGSQGEISYVSWNRKVQPIVASTSYSGTSGQLTYHPRLNDSLRNKETF
jgi:hypothetical protein